MNKNIKKPLVIQLIAPEREPVLRRSPNSLYVPVNTPWVNFRDNVLPLVGDPAYDSVFIHARSDVDRDMKGVVGNIAVKLNALSSAGTRVGKPVMTFEKHDQPFYIINPTRADMKSSGIYAPSDETIMEKYQSFGSDDAWQEYQDKIWNRMKDMMPLSRKADQFNNDHAAQLKDPKRGLEDADLERFWSFKPKKPLSPTLMGDDMVGMPSVEGREYDGFTMTNTGPDGTGTVKPIVVRSLATVGPSGIAIPMANANGHVNKHQIATDLTAYGTVLHFRASDGVTVAKGELFDKKTREYKFCFNDGSPTHLKIADTGKDDSITLQDDRGLFNVKFKKEIVDVLKDRDYNVPDIIASVKTEQNGKYMWQSPGTMTGSDKVLKTVSPSNPGFIVAREPKAGDDAYVVLVAEGALKGHIVAKYVDVTDSQGVCFGDKIAGNHGIIVTQVPGVAEAYVKNALTIYDKYNVAGTYIAMDADGRENRNVARGIHSAHKYLSQAGPTSVLSWDPAQKGMDDALLAVAQGKITIDDMHLISGTPEALFPIESAHVMLPYRLDGTRSKTQSWVQEYEDQKQARIQKVDAAQKETARREEPKPEAKDQWVQTPDDISNIQNATITKAAEIKDAMEGNLPPSKAEAQVRPTPDVDELAEKETTTKEPELSEAQKTIQKWEKQNPSMEPIPVPDGYRSIYRYEQTVQYNPSEVTEKAISRQGLRHGQHLATESDGTVITAIASDQNHNLSHAEQDAYRKQLEADHITCLGDMRLTSQTFKAELEMDIQLSADDLKIQEPDHGPAI